MRLAAVVAWCGLALAAPLASSVQASGGEADGWRSLEPGLDLGEFTSPVASTVGDSRVTVARIDPGRFAIDLYSANISKLPGAAPVDASVGAWVPIGSWGQQQRLVAAINGGMFEPGGRTTGYARIGGVELNPNWKANYGAMLALGPDDPKLPAATILDPECDDVKAQEKHYRVVLQSMRMIDCKGANRWAKSARIWSTAALGIDDQGRVLFIHARSPWDVHDFNEILLALPVGARRVMYLEGGPEASLLLDAGGLSTVRVGSFETGFREDDTNTEAWALPNVIGARRFDGQR